MSIPAFLLIPTTTRGNGTGHLVRCVSLARKLGKSSAVYVQPKDDAESSGLDSLKTSFPDLFSDVTIVTDIDITKWDAIILDVRETSPVYVKNLATHDFVIGLDLSGPGRNEAHYLIDMLNRPLSRSEIPPNLVDPGYLDLPQNVRDFPRTFKKILITFGGEDPKRLTDKTVAALANEQLFSPESIDVIPGTLYGVTDILKSSGVNILDRVADLKERLHEWDVVVTQYGITAYEALWAGCAVVLINPTEYHTALTISAGFPFAGTATADPDLMRKILERPESLERTLKAIKPAEKKSLSNAILAIDFTHAGRCPVCESLKSSVLSRHALKTYRRCGDCGTIFMDRHGGSQKTYSETYFFEEYKRQYGKTYLEDFRNLTFLANSRIGKLSRVGHFRGGEKVLDIGCAYGPFLKALKTAGFEPYGIDISTEAIGYVNEQLGLPAIVEDFPKPSPVRFGIAQFDAVTMWYVIEHFRNFDSMMREVSGIVKPGGILAFSTPSGSGVSARFNTRDFFEQSPDDHAVILEPARMKALLARYGFTLRKIVVTGHHPERFRLFKERIRGFRHSLGMISSVVLRLGDTFEVYAVRD